MKKKELKRKLKQQEIVTRLLITKLKAQNSIKTELSKMQVPNEEDSLEQRIKFFLNPLFMLEKGTFLG